MRRFILLLVFAVLLSALINPTDAAKKKEEEDEDEYEYVKPVLNKPVETEEQKATRRAEREERMAKKQKWKDEQAAAEQKEKDKDNAVKDTWMRWFEHFIQSQEPSDLINEDWVPVPDAVEEALKVKLNTTEITGMLRSLQSIFKGLSSETSRLWRQTGSYHSVMASWIPFIKDAREEIMWKKCAQMSRMEGSQATMELDENGLPTVTRMASKFSPKGAEEGCKKWFKNCMLNSDDVNNDKAGKPQYLVDMERHINTLSDNIQDFLSFNKRVQTDKARKSKDKILKELAGLQEDMREAEHQWPAYNVWVRTLKAALTAVEDQQIKTRKEIRDSLRSECDNLPGCELTKEFMAYDMDHVPGSGHYPDLLKHAATQINLLENKIKETKIRRKA